jgi:hypothetical protein
VGILDNQRRQRLHQQIPNHKWKRCKRRGIIIFINIYINIFLLHYHEEKAIILLLLRNDGSATQADIRYEVEIPKSSLTGIINALNRKNIIKKREYGRTNIIELSEWFLSKNKVH